MLSYNSPNRKPILSALWLIYFFWECIEMGNCPSSVLLNGSDEPGLYFAPSLLVRLRSNALLCILLLFPSVALSTMLVSTLLYTEVALSVHQWSTTATNTVSQCYFLSKWCYRIPLAIHLSGFGYIQLILEAEWWQSVTDQWRWPLPLSPHLCSPSHISQSVWFVQRGKGTLRQGEEDLLWGTSLCISLSPNCLPLKAVVSEGFPDLHFCPVMGR